MGKQIGFEHLQVFLVYSSSEKSCLADGIEPSMEYDVNFTYDVLTD